MAPHSSVLAWRIPGMGEPGGLPSMRSHRVRHNWSDLAAAEGKSPGKLQLISFLRQIYVSGGAVGKESACQCRRCMFESWVRKILCRKEWQPTPVFLPGEFHGQRSLVGYSLWGCKELDMTKQACKDKANTKKQKKNLNIALAKIFIQVFLED